MDMILGLLKSVVENYSAMFPSWLVGILLLVGTLRLVIKPAFAFAYAITAVTPSLKDDAAVKKLEEGKTMKAVKFVIDWLASIKLPAKK